MEPISQGDFHGLPTGRLDNGVLEVEFLRHAGPRLVRLSWSGSADNLLAETPAVGWDTPHGRYHLRGGHRLWVAPETRALTSIPDDSGLTVEARLEGALLLQPAEPITGLQKSIEITLPPDGASLRLVHTLANQGSATVELAPWAITMLRPGGIAILPHSTEPVDPDALLPNRSLVLWPYTRWQDARLHLSEGFVFVECRPVGSQAKVGTFNRQGWLGYRWKETLFVKRFEAQPEMARADMGCNAEVYVCDEYLELESLGPLVRLAPGVSTMHTETWDVCPLDGSVDLPGPLVGALESLDDLQRRGIGPRTA